MKHIDITMLAIIQQNPTTLGRSLSLDHLNPLMKYAKHINISTSDMIAMNRITSVSVIMVFFTSGFLYRYVVEQLSAAWRQGSF